MVRVVIKFTFCVHFINYASNLLVLEGLPNTLHTLRIHSDQCVTDDVLGQIVRYHSKLQAFNLPLYSARLITNTGLCVALSYWYNLRTFIATGDYGYDFVRKARNPENAVVKVPVVDDSVLYALVQNCPLLTTLDMSGNTELSNEALCEIAKLVLLKHFTANGCWLMEDSALAAITLACTDLTHIELSECRITDVGVRTMAIHRAHKLRHVSLTDCMYLNNSCIQQLIRASRKLQLLRIRNNSNVSFAAVSELPLYCPYIEVLCQYYKCLTLGRRWRRGYSQISPSDAHLLAQNCPPPPSAAAAASASRQIRQSSSDLEVKRSGCFHFDTSFFPDCFAFILISSRLRSTKFCGSIDPWECVQNDLRLLTFC